MHVPVHTAMRQLLTAPNTRNRFLMWSLCISSVSVCSPVRRWLSASCPYPKVTRQASAIPFRLSWTCTGAVLVRAQQPFSRVLQAENLHRYQEALHKESEKCCKEQNKFLTELSAFSSFLVTILGKATTPMLVTSGPGPNDSVSSEPRLPWTAELERSSGRGQCGCFPPILQH